MPSIFEGTQDTPLCDPRTLGNRDLPASGRIGENCPISEKTA
jgi:hypothetical protein